MGKTKRPETNKIEKFGIVHCTLQSSLVKEHFKLKGLIYEHIERKDRIYPFLMTIR